MTQKTKPVPSDYEPLRRLLASFEEIEFAVLVGSRAQGTANKESDWDIALHWQHGLSAQRRISRTEEVRRALAESLQLPESHLDLIDLTRANLAMRAAVAEEGIPLKGDDTLAWSHFLTRTWRDLEDFYWEQAHAA